LDLFEFYGNISLKKERYYETCFNIGPQAVGKMTVGQELAKITVINFALA
jgi:hypothetical protein